MYQMVSTQIFGPSIKSFVYFTWTVSCQITSIPRFFKQGSLIGISYLVFTYIGSETVYRPPTWSTDSFCSCQSRTFRPATINWPRTASRPWPRTTCCSLSARARSASVATASPSSIRQPRKTPTRRSITRHLRPKRRSELRALRQTPTRPPRRTRSTASARLSSIPPSKKSSSSYWVILWSRGARWKVRLHHTRSSQLWFEDEKNFNCLLTATPKSLFMTWRMMCFDSLIETKV